MLWFTNLISYDMLFILALISLLLIGSQWYVLFRKTFALARSNERLHALQTSAAENDISTQHLRTQLHVAEQAKHALETKLAALTSQLSEQDKALAVATAKQQAADVHYSKQLALLEDARKQLKLEFENVANRIFEEKSVSMVASNKQRLDQTLLPLREQLSEFKRKVEDVYDKESKERLSLLHEIGTLKSLNQQISQDAINLTRALKSDTKAQGNWGEVVLERVLEESGLRKGHEYETQISLKQDSGQRHQPDVIVHLPDNKDIVIDAKVSLLDYERYCSAETDAEKQQHLKAHLASMRSHLKGISAKNYDNLNGITSLDFILIFVPIEPAFLLAFEQDGKLFSEAYDRGVIIVSPTTLLAVLRTIQSLWRYERQNQNADEIARLAGSLYDKVAGVAQSLTAVGEHLDKAQKAQEMTMARLHSGKGNLVSTAQRLEKLGAKSKKAIPQQLLSSDENEDE